MHRGMRMEEGSRSSRQHEPGVVAIECVAGGSRAEEWGPGSSEMVQTGDVVEELHIGRGGGAATHAAPFKGGKAGVQKLLHATYKAGETSVEVRVRRPAQHHGSEELAAAVATMQACIVPRVEAGGGAGAMAAVRVGRSRRYVLRSIRDPNYAVGFVDRMESECIAIRGSRSSRVVCALSKAQLQDGYVSYPWEKKMKAVLPIAGASSFLSMLVLPKAIDSTGSRYHSVEDTLARANAWLLSSQVSGVPVAFLNVQTEALLTKVSGEMASATVNSGSLADLSNLANASLYGFEDYHGVDIGVVKAVRVWYTAAAGELLVEITLEESDTKLGFGISRTEEGFIYVSSVIEDDDDGRVPSTRSGLRDLYREAQSASKLLVISRVSNHKVLPWMVSTSGAIRCFDTVSLSQKLSLHRHALRPIQLHVLMWESMPSVAASDGMSRPPEPLLVFAELRQNSFACTELPPPPERGPGIMQERDTAGDISLRFHDFSLSDDWV